MNSSRSVRPARTTAGRSPRDWSVGDTVRCPWHHARFSLRTGEAIGAPAFNPVRVLARGQARRQGVRARARSSRADRRRRGQARSASENAERVVIVGGGAAGIRDRRDASARRVCRQRHAAVRRRRRPYDRPNCSKDYLAGNAPEDWMPLRAGRILPRACDRRRARHRGRPAIDVEGATGGARGRAKRGLRQARARDRRRADSPRHSRRERAARPRAALARRRTRDHRKRKGGAARRRASARASSGSRSPRRCAPASWRSMSWPRSGGRWSACSAVNSATSFANCTKSTASSSISKRRQPRSTARRSS